MTGPDESGIHVLINGMLLRRPYSGVEQSIVRLVRALDRYGTQRYTLVAPRGFRDGELSGERVAVRCAAASSRWRALRIAYEHTRMPALAQRERSSVVHAPGYVVPMRLPVPSIVTVYDLIALDYPEWCRKTNALYYRLFMERSVRAAAGIIVPSECTRRDLARRFPEMDPYVRVIPLGIGVEFKDEPNPDVLSRHRREMGLPSRFALFVGQSEPKKDIPTLVRAYARLRQNGRFPCKLVIAGKRGWAQADVERVVRENGLEGEVTLLGPVADDRLPMLYNLAEMFVFPSRYEGFGLPPLEAMACGTPVICTSAGALAENTGSAAMHVKVGDAESLAAAMQTLVADTALRAELLAAGLERVRKYSWRRCAEDIEQFYLDVYTARAVRPVERM